MNEECGMSPKLTSVIRPLNLPLDEDTETGWKPYPLFSGSTPALDSFGSHVSVLSPGVMPHQPHAHREEELLIMLSGEGCLVLPDIESPGAEKRITLCPGSFVYYPAFRRHSIFNKGPAPATYLMFKWYKNSVSTADFRLPTTILRYDGDATSVNPEPVQGIGFKEFLNGPTRYLSKLQCHVTTMEPGDGYQPHSDPYDVVIVSITGILKTLGQTAKSRSVIFYAAGEPHGMINGGQSTARYLVFEFHG